MPERRPAAAPGTPGRVALAAMAKAPVAGAVKTRLCPPLRPERGRRAGALLSRGPRGAARRRAGQRPAAGIHAAGAGGGAPRARAARRSVRGPARRRPRRADERTPVGPPRGGLRRRDRGRHGHADVADGLPRPGGGGAPSARGRRGAGAERGRRLLPDRARRRPRRSSSSDIPWSTATVYEETLRRAHGAGRSSLRLAHVVRRRPHRGPGAASRRPGEGRLSASADARLLARLAL